ncbi:MAG: hypothetical protein GXY55_04595 [Phycisphaerae bacterium]|nr:hypothetical protein [Phycisphaerae bacterium]
MAISVNMTASTFQLLNSINRLDAERSVTMARLASGNRINRAADDPSGLVAISGMKSDLVRINAALDNAQRSQAVLDTADTALQQVSTLVQEIERLANKGRDPSATSAEKAAYQTSIDQNLDAINSLISNTEFGGKKLLTGTGANISATAVQATKYTDLRVHTAANATANKVFSVAFTAATKVVTVDGTEVGKANANGDEIHFTKDGYSMSFVVADVSANVAASNITVTASEGMLFQLGSDSTTQVRMDMAAGITTAKLGNSVLGYLSSLRSGGTNALSNDGNKAVEIAAKASSQVSIAQSRVGSFSKYQIGSSIAVLQATAEGLNASIAAINETDYAAETAKLERQNTLMDAGLTMLQMVNSQQSNALYLLRGY